MNILYIHGFNSAGFGGKVDDLRAAFGAASVINPTLPTQPAAAMALLDKLCERFKGPDFCVLGSSLGGFYALNLALRHGIRAVLVNPAVREVAQGLAYAQGPQTNYKTGETYTFSAQDLQDLANLELQPSDWPRLQGQIFAYLDAEDEVLPAPQIAEFLQRQNLAVTLYPGGNHQFQHMPELLQDLRSRWELP